MKKLIFIFSLIISISAYSQNKLEALADYCVEVRNAYIDGTKGSWSDELVKNLEQTISGYGPSRVPDKLTFNYKGVPLNLSYWDDGLKIKGKEFKDSDTPPQFLDPVSVDNYLAWLKEMVVLNDIPLLRAFPYDFLYTNLYVKGNSKISLGGESLGDTNLLIISNSNDNINIHVSCKDGGVDENVVLNSDNPLHIFNWKTNSKHNFNVSIENLSTSPVTVFVAKD